MEVSMTVTPLVHVTVSVTVTLPVRMMQYMCIWKWQCMWHCPRMSVRDCDTARAYECPWLWHCPCIWVSVIVILPVHVSVHDCDTARAYECPWVWHCPCIWVSVIVTLTVHTIQCMCNDSASACDSVRDCDTVREYDTLCVHMTVPDVTLFVHVALSVDVCHCLWNAVRACNSVRDCDNVRACDSVRECDTAYVCDILPHSSGMPFRDLLDSTGWFCYSTLVPLPILSKQTGDTVPAGTTDATDSSLPLLTANPLQRAATILSQTVWQRCRYLWPNTRVTNGKNSDVLLEAPGYNLGLGTKQHTWGVTWIYSAVLPGKGRPSIVS